MDEIDLGYRYKKSAWGKGYATEAARSTLDNAFNDLELTIITGRTQIENTASIKGIEKTGMRYTREEIVAIAR